MTHVTEKQDALQDYVNDVRSSIHRIRYADISSLEKDKLLVDVLDSLDHIVKLRV